MVKLADTLPLGGSGRKAVGVQVPLPALLKWIPLNRIFLGGIVIRKEFLLGAGAFASGDRTGKDGF